MNASGKIVHMWNKQEIEFEEMKILRGSKSFESKTIYQSIGGFPMVIKTKIRYPKILGYHILPYKIMITTNYKKSYFSFDSIGNPPNM